MLEIDGARDAGDEITGLKLRQQLAPDVFAWHSSLSDARIASAFLRTFSGWL